MSPRLLAYGVAAVIFLADRVSKELIRAYVTLWDTLPVIPGFFNIVHAENRGAAFGIFADSKSEWRTFFLFGISLIILVLVAAALWHPSGNGYGGAGTRLGLALVLGGALGNMFDRIAHGTVTDFLDLYLGSYHWPAFNVADSAITIGAGLLLLDLWRSRHKAAA